MSNNPSPLNFGSSQTQKSVETNEDGFAPFETSVSKVSEPVADRELLNSILIKDKKNVNLLLLLLRKKMFVIWEQVALMFQPLSLNVF